MMFKFLIVTLFIWSCNAWQSKELMNVTMDYVIRSDNRMTLACKVDTNQKNLTDFSNVLLRCPQVKSNVCSINCLQTCIQREDKCYVSEDLYKTLEDCEMRKEESEGRITVEYLVNLSELTMSGKWFCEYRGKKSKAHLLKMIPKEEELPITTETEYIDPGVTEKTFKLDPLTTETAAEVSGELTIIEFFTDKFKKITKKTDFVWAFIIGFVLSVLLNTILLIRCCLSKAYLDNLRKGQVKPFLSRCLCIDMDKKGEHANRDSLQKENYPGFFQTQIMNYSEGIDSGIYAGHFLQPNGSQSGSMIYQPIPANIGYHGPTMNFSHPSMSQSQNHMNPICNQSEDGHSSNSMNDTNPGGPHSTSPPSTQDGKITYLTTNKSATPFLLRPASNENSNDTRYSAEFNQVSQTGQSQRNFVSQAGTPSRDFGTIKSRNANQMFSVEQFNGNLITRPVIFDGVKTSNCQLYAPQKMHSETNSVDSFIIARPDGKGSKNEVRYASPLHIFPHTPLMGQKNI